MNCLICLSDKSGNFGVFGAETAQNTVISEKTGFGMDIETAPRPVFVFSEEKSRVPFGANALSKVGGKSLRMVDLNYKTLESEGKIWQAAQTWRGKTL